MIKTKISQKPFSPLRYPGGKTSLFEYFDQVIKTNKWYNVVYVEPYAGGAGAALSLLFLEKVDSIVINDLDPAIYAFWHSVVNETKSFIEMIKQRPATVREWRKQKDIYKDYKNYSQLELGFATFFLNRTNHSGILNGGPIGGLSQEGRWKIDARYNKKRLIERIELIALYKDRITVTKKDGKAIIKKYSTNPNAFFYIDPPYFVKGKDLYLNAFKLADHKKLAHTLNRLPDMKWILTYDNEKEIRKLYSERRQKDFSLKYSAHHSAVGSEIMIFSDAICLPFNRLLY